jgi:putative transposase
MPRTPRKKSRSDIYHIMLRGINHQNIFEHEGDYEKFIDILDTYRIKVGYEVYAYCLMGNHAHLLVREGNEDLSNTMKRIGTSYVHWYNWQYNRKGHLFQDRYKSEAVEDDRYFLTVLRYIHQNPVKGKLADSIDLYDWSSYREYTTEARIINTDYAFSMFHQNRSKALESFKRFNMGANDDKCLDITEKRKTLSDKELRQLMLEKYNIELASLQNEHPATQTEILKYLKKIDGTSLRQLSRLTGLTLNKIFRA